MRRLIPVLLALAFVPSPARADWPITQAACPGVTASVSVWKQLGTNTLENLGFDGLGNVWISNSSTSQIQRFDSAGNANLPGAGIAVNAPGAIVKGPDGLLYVNFGDGLANALQRNGTAGVFRFDPSSPPAVAPAAFASGINMANGGAFDAAGNLWVSNDVDNGLTRIAPNGSHTTFNVWGTNGLVAYGDSIYAAITFDQRSPIERVPLADPDAHATWTELSFGALSAEPAAHVPQADPLTTPLVGLKGLDDMARGPLDGRLYVVANGMGELLRVELTGPSAGSACVLASGLQNPSSVRFAENFGPYTGDIFITEFSGAIRRVHLS